MEVFFRYHLRAISCSCFSSQKVGKQDLCSCFAFWLLKTLSGSKRSFCSVSVTIGFLTPDIWQSQTVSLVFFFLPFVENLAFSPFFRPLTSFSLSLWFSGCPRWEETGASELIRCFAFRPFRPWTLHAFASFVEQIAFHSVRLELRGWNILAQQLVKHFCRCPNIVQFLSSVIYGWIFG